MKYLPFILSVMGRQRKEWVVRNQEPILEMRNGGWDYRSSCGHEKTV